jgi:hypothetical protein
MGGEGTPSGDPGGKSYGNISDRHWSRSRSEANREALEYYRSRSRAPGVREGGAERNFYCMACDGVIPHDGAAAACPHCGEPLDEAVRRYFNWVEVDRRTKSDFRAVLPLLLAGLAVAGVLTWVLVSWLVG